MVGGGEDAHSWKVVAASFTGICSPPGLHNIEHGQTVPRGNTCEVLVFPCAFGEVGVNLLVAAQENKAC